MEIHGEISEGDKKKLVITAVQGDLPKTDEAPKFAALMATAKVLGWVSDNTVIRTGRLNLDDEAGLLLDRSNFYAEQGGQVGDTGVIRTSTGMFEVADTQKLGDAVLHVGRVSEGYVEPNQAASLEVGGARRTPCATTPRRTCSTGPCARCWATTSIRRARWSIPTRRALTSPTRSRSPADEIAEVEKLVNEKIYADLPVTAVTMPLAEAKKMPGVRAVFGEKYPDPVRVLLIGVEKSEQATRETRSSSAAARTCTTPARRASSRSSARSW